MVIQFKDINLHRDDIQMYVDNHTKNYNLDK